MIWQTGDKPTNSWTGFNKYSTQIYMNRKIHCDKVYIYIYRYIIFKKYIYENKVPWNQSAIPSYGRHGSCIHSLASLGELAGWLPKKLQLSSAGFPEETKPDKLRGCGV